MLTAQLYPVQSAYVSQYYPNQNFADPTNLYFGRFNGAGDIYRTLLQFSLASIPADSMIHSVQLIFTITRNEIPSTSLIYGTLNQAESSWSQSGVTWNNQPSFSPINTFALSPLDTPDTAVIVDVTSVFIPWFNFMPYGFVITGNEVLNSLIGIANYPAVSVAPTPCPPPFFREFHEDYDWGGRNDHCGQRHHHRCFDRDLFRSECFAPHHGVVGTSVAVQEAPGSRNFIVVDQVANAPKLLIHYTFHRYEQEQRFVP